MEGSQKAQNDELKHHKEKLEKKEQIRKTLLLFKSMLNDKKLSEIEIENNENLERLEYNRKKQEQEEEYKKELMKKKNLREREINKVQANQKASQDTQALKDELMAIRIQDKVEREFRRKELEDEMKKIQINNDLKEARRQQIESNRESAIMEEKIDQEHLKQQMVEKEFEKIKERRMFFREGVTYQENKNAREKALRMTVEEKIAELNMNQFSSKLKWYCNLKIATVGLVSEAKIRLA
ncbi:probable serine/threonine-protein kinase irlB [Sipha flava]|uniref:Cilia- and flagella-associated protein 45 n=1 Tax=Sipha flava TaxID=143950 RepID=A0A8B8GG86_9HEMI|nr:probable serine/threonine-protein kinase irlB [Sipha flava]